MSQKVAEITATVAMNAEEACVALGISSRTLYTRAKSGEIQKQQTHYLVPLTQEVQQRVAELAARCGIESGNGAEVAIADAATADTIAASLIADTEHLREIDRLRQVEAQLLERLTARDEELRKLRENVENAEIRKDALVAQSQKLLEESQRRLEAANVQLLALKPAADSVDELQQELLQARQTINELETSRPRGLWGHLQAWWQE